MNTDKYILQEVTTSAQEREWLDLPKKIYKGNRNWVCPLDQDITEVFDPARNELFADGEAVRWVVRNKAGEVVGRIAAFYNREKAAIEEQPTGGCGFFEAIDDQQVADMMFDASRMWLASRGMEAMDGPVNFGQRDAWWGLLVEGYEFQPLYENPYNPPYYKELFENYGFRNYFNQNTYIWKIYDDDVNAMVHDRAKRLFSTPGYGFRQIDMSRIEEEAENFRIIYNKAWSLFSGVKPMTQEEAMKIMKQYNVKDLGSKGGDMWWENKYKFFYPPYMFHMPQAFGTLDTVATFSDIKNVYRAMKKVVNENFPEARFIGHFSHWYEWGCMLYARFIFEQAPADPREAADLYNRVWDLAIRAAIANGGVINEHHGVGLKLGRLMKELYGPAKPLVLDKLKKELDPNNIMNPGKMGFGF